MMVIAMTALKFAEVLAAEESAYEYNQKLKFLELYYKTALQSDQDQLPPDPNAPPPSPEQLAAKQFKQALGDSMSQFVVAKAMYQFLHCVAGPEVLRSEEVETLSVSR